jgi:hypothetical protein
VRDLKEAVFGHYRPDLYRLKEDVVARVTRQGGLPLTKGVENRLANRKREPATDVIESGGGILA